MTTDLFHRLVAEGEAGLAYLVEVRQQEGVQLELKSKANPADGNDDKEDRKNLGQALSGFSNSMGGLLIWGVEAKKNDEGIDCARALRPIHQIERFKSRVTSLVGDLLSPKNDDVHVEMVPSAGAPGCGYLLVQIGRSERRPHRSEAANDGRYYKRVGDSFYAMEHYDIEDMFKRHTVPVLVLVSDELGIGTDGRDWDINIRVGLRNDGPISARFPYLNAIRLHNFSIYKFGLDGNGTFGLPRKVGQPQMEANFSGGANDLIHPGQVLYVFKLQSRIQAYPNEAFVSLSRRIPATAAELAFGCADVGVQKELLKFTSEQIATAICDR